MKAAKGEKGLVEPSYVYLPGVLGGDVIKEANGGLDFFSVPVELGVSCRSVLSIPIIHCRRERIADIAVPSPTVSRTPSTLSTASLTRRRVCWKNAFQN